MKGESLTNHLFCWINFSFVTIQPPAKATTFDISSKLLWSRITHQNRVFRLERHVSLRTLLRFRLSPSKVNTGRVAKFFELPVDKTFTTSNELEGSIFLLDSNKQYFR